ncbi:MAG: metallophosphoesterase [Clostridiales bacterium]|nr:metallophosphoesterase [Clostridiales bacterium]
MSVIKLVIAFFMSITQLIAPYAQFLFHGGIDSFFEKWDESTAFTKEYAVELAKDPDKDFVVVNLADVQLNDGTVYGDRGVFTEELVDDVIEEAKAKYGHVDLITLTGDNASGDLTYLRWIKVIDSYNIPWAPIMGNHDGHNGEKLNEAWDAYHLSKAKNCLFKFGPKDMGFGNYVINITENGEIIHTLFMMDSHSEADDTDAGKINGDGYDHFWPAQLEWYKWCVNGIKTIAGKNVESTVMMHIPAYEYKTAREKMVADGTMLVVKNEAGETNWVLKEENEKQFGMLGEDICSPTASNGFFALAKRLSSTTRMIAGHDHKNNLCINYEGIDLCYGLKSGKGSYYSEDMLGGSVLTVNSDGHSSFNHIYYDVK